MVSVRDAFFNRIYANIAKGEDIVVVTSDLGAPSLDQLRADYPERYISVGISEQNLIATACGLALSGRGVVAYGLNPFVVTRAYDQIRSLMNEKNIPITLCALNAGLCSAESGYTHMPIEDIGMMRMLGNIDVINPTDTNISEIMADKVSANIRPKYIRFDKIIKDSVYNKAEIDLDRGYVVTGENIENDLTIITCGCYVRELMPKIIELLSKNVKISLIDLFSLSFDEAMLIKEIKKAKKVITVEENVLPAGIGSLILELMSDYELNIPVLRMGLNVKDGYYKVFTNREYIRKHQGIDMEEIYQRICRCISGTN